MEKLSKKQLLERTSEIVKKYDELKTVVNKILDDMDKLEKEYYETIEKIKQE